MHKDFYLDLNGENRGGDYLRVRIVRVELRYLKLGFIQLKR